MPAKRFLEFAATCMCVLAFGARAQMNVGVEPNTFFSNLSASAKFSQPLSTHKVIVLRIKNFVLRLNYDPIRMNSPGRNRTSVFPLFNPETVSPGQSRSL